MLSKNRKLILPPVELALIDIRSRFNVGSIFRTADAAGISTIHLVGYTPAPPHKEISKVSLGSELTVPYKTVDSPVAFLKTMKRRGYSIAAIETGKTSIPYTRFKKPDGKLLLVAGNEISGLSPQILNLCDDQLSIPMSGIKESLNVGIAFAVVAYRIAFP